MITEIEIKTDEKNIEVKGFLDYITANSLMKTIYNERIDITDQLYSQLEDGFDSLCEETKNEKIKFKYLFSKDENVIEIKKDKNKSLKIVTDISGDNFSFSFTKKGDTEKYTFPISKLKEVRKIGIIREKKEDKNETLVIGEYPRNENGELNNLGEINSKIIKILFSIYEFIFDKSNAEILEQCIKDFEKDELVNKIREMLPGNNRKTIPMPMPNSFI